MITISRRRLLKHAALLGGGLASGALAQACQWLPQAEPEIDNGCETSRPASSARAERTPIPTVTTPEITFDPSLPPGNPAISHVVLIVVDGMMPEYLDLGTAPILQALVRDGTSFSRSWVGHVANNTPVSHTSLASGQLPRRTGVVYFGWREPETGRMFRMNTAASEAGVFAAKMREQHIPSLGRVMKRHRPGTTVASIGSTKDFAPVCMALDSADHVGYAVRVSAAEAGLALERELTGEERKNRGKNKDAGAQVVNEEATIPVRKLIPGGPFTTPLPSDILCDPSFHMVTREVGDNDVFAGNLAVGVFERVKPELLMVNFPDNDQIGHLTGGHLVNPGAVGKVMARVDEQIGRLVDAYRKAGLYDKTLWVIVSDHGMTPNSLNVTPTFVDAALSDAGIQRIGGDTAHFWLKNLDEIRLAAGTIDEGGAEGVVGTYFKVDYGNDRYFYEPTKLVESHLPARMRSAVEYLFDTYACFEGPDLSLVLAENVHFQTKAANTVGAHSEATWMLQKIPIIFSGPGVRKDYVSPYPARLVDVTPTILALLSLPAEDMDGVPLQDALAESSPASRDAQLNHPETRRMLRHQDMLMEMSRLGRKLAEEA